MEKIEDQYKKLEELEEQKEVKEEVSDTDQESVIPSESLYCIASRPLVA
jgi:hypothetical protein